MEHTKSRGMKALTISLVAASALILAIILIAYSGASRRADETDGETTDTGSGTQENPTANLGYEDPESTEAETTAEVTTEETTAEPVYELAFTSNGDGTCYVSGLGTYRSNEVSIPTLSPSGDIVTGIGKYAFYNKTSIVRVSIPSTVRTVGEYAFLGCTSLIEITVSSSNSSFRTDDGILYSKDGTRLICCPAMRGKTSCTVSGDVTVIESGAFANAKNLKTVYYKGSAADWTEINIEAHNDLLEQIRLVCNYSEK